MEKNLIIISDYHAKEVNGPKPNFNWKNFKGPLKEFMSKADELLKWEVKQENLITYKIEFAYLVEGEHDSLVKWGKVTSTFKSIIWPIGEVVKCETNEETRTAIILR